MKFLLKVAELALPAVMAGMWCPRGEAQSPATVAPIIVDTAVPIIVNTVKPKPSGLTKFEGFVMNANTAQITVRAKGNDMAVRTFTLSEKAASKMQTIVDKGGYQYGDKVTVLYDPVSLKAVRLKGKPLPSSLIRGADNASSSCGCWTFLSSDRAELSALVAQYTERQNGATPGHVKACLVPHAGYMYSGHVAGAVFAKIRLPRKIVILGVRHRPPGSPAAIISSGAWRTPLGRRTD